ncbi:hypothetical protein HYFRA_00008410 [Hymenoscyphus fraxineus]|uniref:2EXR domain-containing protein n=1 Tax=Hymenoscyphus fraxineus TaxID=746836 RepID=A0A9N9KP33_9HELO|nr:hypothetical protein HYFRA_00008410 [Hymenoscyphus fraxineus]
MLEAIHNYKSHPVLPQTIKSTHFHRLTESHTKIDQAPLSLENSSMEPVNTPIDPRPPFEGLRRPERTWRTVGTRYPLMGGRMDEALPGLGVQDAMAAYATHRGNHLPKEHPRSSPGIAASTTNEITVSGQGPVFNDLPTELKIEILHLAAEKRTIVVTHQNGKWAAECFDDLPAVLQVNKEFRAAMIGVQFYDVQAPRDIRLPGPNHECVYFNPTLDDIIFELGTGPGGDKLLHWVEPQCLPKIRRITVLRGGIEGRWRDDFYYKELAYGLLNLGRVKELVFSWEGCRLDTSVELVSEYPEGRAINRNGTILFTETVISGQSVEIYQWMDIKLSDQTPDFVPRRGLFRDIEKIPPYTRYSWRKYAPGTWQPDIEPRPFPFSNGWGQDAETYTTDELLNMWFDHIKRQDEGWTAPRIFIGEVDIGFTPFVRHVESPYTHATDDEEGTNDEEENDKEEENHNEE